MDPFGPSYCPNGGDGFAGFNRVGWHGHRRYEGGGRSEPLVINPVRVPPSIVIEVIPTLTGR